VGLVERDHLLDGRKEFTGPKNHRKVDSIKYPDLGLSIRTRWDSR